MFRKFLVLASVMVVLAGGFGFWRLWVHTGKGTIKPYLVSLGDSVAAGDGLPVYADNASTAAACNQSDKAYPNLVATKLGLLLAQFACSGAKVTTGLLQPQTASGQTLPPQLTSSKQYIPGSDVLLTVGANDVDWATMLTHCAQANCSGSDDLVAFQAKLEQLRSDLATALKAINISHPHVLVINTYYALINASDTCFSAYGITADKIEFVNAREAELNAEITAAAMKANATVVTVDFSGHLLCDKTPWLQGVFDRAPLHPNLAGQEQIAHQDAAALQ